MRRFAVTQVALRKLAVAEVGLSFFAVAVGKEKNDSLLYI